MKIKEMMEICRESESGDDFDCVDDIRSAVYHGPWLMYQYDDDGGDENDDEDGETGDANYENDDVAGGGDDFPPR